MILIQKKDIKNLIGTKIIFPNGEALINPVYLKKA